VTWLLDANVLIALATADHVDHLRAADWFFSQESRPFASCPITQGALIRFQIRFGRNIKAKDAWALLLEICALPNHEFWPDDIQFERVSSKGIIGHRQVTDAYLVALTMKRKGRVATMDEGLAALHPGQCTLIPR
jgi:toxin-antitoxin system PIN domain toxin